MANQSSCCLRISLALLLICVWSVVSATRENDNTCSDEGNVCTEKVNIENEHPQCQLYLAPSSIPNAGIGVYTSVHFKKGDHIGENELLIPVINLPQEDIWLIDDVQWGVDLDPRLYYEANSDTTCIFMPGFGAQINCHFGLNNVEHEKPKFDSAGLHRSKDPGVGAFTYWHDMPNIALRDIQPGEELFTNYGDGWFTSRTSVMGDIPRYSDFVRADRIVRKMQIAKSMAARDGYSAESEVFSDIWDMVLRLSNQALMRALPQRHEELDEAIKHGVARHSIGGESSIRSQEWLNANGMCIDNIYVNISTIPQAGRGAFAKRFLPKDSVVSPAPVLQVHHGWLVNQTNDRVQLLFNYAFGHPESSLLLVPYSSTVNFINHDSQNPNVKLQWSSSPLHRKEFLDFTSEEVLEKGFGLLMEFVALRDIQPNEEILLDYGSNWERAWKAHIAEWQPNPESDDYITADDAIEVMGILTIEEQKTKPYPENIQTACFFYPRDDTVYQNITNSVGNVVAYRVEWQRIHKDCLRWCSIIERHKDSIDGDLFYDALLVPQHSNLYDDCIMPSDETIYVDRIPSEAVTLVDRELSRDQHLPNTFRHYIQLPDSTVPSSWRSKEKTGTRHRINKNVDQCQLYIAPSSIPNAGIGVYSTVDYKKGDHIGEGELLLPLTDFPYQEWWLVTDVQWDAGLCPHLYYESNEVNSIYYPGFGAQINCHFGLNNVEHDKPKFDSAGLHRSKDPGVGAFTNWYDMPNIATRDIQAGEELFVDYGYAWFEYRQQYMGDIPRVEDFIHADRIVQKMQAVADKQDFKVSAAPALDDLWFFVRNISTQALERALPQKYEELQEAIKHGTARHSVGGSSSIRSQEWLNENGMCIDNIYVNISTVPQAGRGAFAKRFLPKGSVVSPAPVLQVHRGLLFHQPVGFQLTFNYAFGHPDSPVFLLPYSSTVNFINHDSKHPNVKLQWSSSSLHQKEFLQMSSKEILEKKFGLVMEFVSLRDIQPNEEIFLNYGAQWESAWQEHVANWTPVHGAESYIPASDAVKSMGILTVEEQKLRAYPDNLHTACFFYDTESTVYENITETSVNQELSFTVEWNTMNDDCLRLCDILESHVINGTEEVYYDALLLEQEINLHADCIMSKEEKIYVHKIPRKAVTLVDMKFTRDQHLSNAFRQYIRLPDDIFPKSWRDNRTDLI